MQQKVSLVSALIISFLLGWMSFSRPIDGVMNWDVTGYYFYLPAVFIYNDIELEEIGWMEELRKKYDLSGTLYQFHPVEGRSAHVDQYSAGMAVMYSPAFFTGHFFARALGYEKDGFSRPYQVAMAIWSFIVAIGGIFILRRLLLLFFSDNKTALVLVLVLAGSNYFIQVSRGLCTPHNYLFTLYAAFLFAVVKWHEKSSVRAALSMAVSLGLMCLSRPTEIVAIVIPVAWGCSTLAEIKQKIRRLITKERKTILLIAGVMLVIAVPQFFYWKVSTGHWFYMSYTNPAEGLDLLAPHTVDFLFSYRKGWFIYTPLMLVALTGFFYLYKKRKDLLWPFAAFFLLNLYVVSSWSCWWYAQCFSQRAMVQSLPVMALLLGFSLLWIEEKRRWKIPWTIVVSLFFFGTVFFQWQYENQVLDQWRMTKEYFWAVFGKTSVSEEDKKLLLIDRPFNGEMIFHDRENYTEAHFFNYAGQSAEELKDVFLKDSISIPVKKLSRGTEFTGAIKKRFSSLTKKDHVWIEAQADVWLPKNASAEDLLLVCTADHSGGLYGYRTAGVAPGSLRPDAWNTIRINYLTPEMRLRRDYVAFYMWYRGQDSALVRDFSIRIFEKTR